VVENYNRAKFKKMSGFGDIVFGSTRAMSDDEDEEFEQIQEYFYFFGDFFSVY
jgi:hypothetical protein